MAKSFVEFNQSNRGNALVVDALNLAFRWKHSGAKQFVESYIDTVKSFARSYKCGTVLIAADWGSSSYRKSILPEYKGNRKDLQDKQTDKEKQDFEDFIKEYENTLKALEHQGYQVFRYKNVEADDIAAFIVNNRIKFNLDNIWLISSDRDWDLLIANDVSRFSYVTRKEIRLDNWAELYEFPVDKYITYKSLVGDSGDNIPGIEGIGPKRATSIIQEYGDIFNIYDSIPLPGKQKFIQSLNDNAERLLKNVELMDLLTYCEEAIGYDNCNDIKERLTK